MPERIYCKLYVYCKTTNILNPKSGVCLNGYKSMEFTIELGSKEQQAVRTGNET